MRKKCLIILTAITILGMTGCMKKIDLTDEQESKLISYSVLAVLEHDKNYMIGLNKVELETEPETEETTSGKGESQGTTTTDPSGNGSSTGDEGTTVTTTMADALGLEGVSVTYSGIAVCDQFPEADGTPAFVIKALSGHKLVVLKFDVTNDTGSDMKIDMTSKENAYKGIFNKSIKTNALVTLLPEALNTFSETIPAGKTVQTVMVFEMSDGYVNDLSSIVLEFKSESGTKSVKIK